MTTAADMYLAYLAAELALIGGAQEHRVGDTMYRRADLDMIIAGRKEWERKASTEAAQASKSPTIGGLSFAVARMD